MKVFRSIFGILIAILLFIVLLVAFGSVLVGIIYMQDNKTIYVQMEEMEGEIQLRPYSNLLKTVVRVYYCEGGEETLLGHFETRAIVFMQKGNYNVSVDGDMVVIQYPFFESDPKWEEKTFTLPTE